MGRPLPFAAEKLVIGVLTSRMGGWDALASGLVRRFGPADFTSSPIPFDFSPYYDDEMGPGIQRLFVSFTELVDPSTLAAVKAETNALEDFFREQGDRKVNLDPGLLNLSRFILASTKDSSHRVPLSGGMFAEITLVFEHGTFRPVEWTYPDYRSPGYISILNEIRGLYKAQAR
jgi:hypothetical protein